MVTSSERREHVSLLLLDVDHFKAYNEQMAISRVTLPLHVVTALQSGTMPRSTSSRATVAMFVILLPGMDGAGRRAGRRVPHHRRAALAPPDDGNAGRGSVWPRGAGPRRRRSPGERRVATAGGPDGGKLRRALSTRRSGTGCILLVPHALSTAAVVAAVEDEERRSDASRDHEEGPLA